MLIQDTALKKLIGGLLFFVKLCIPVSYKEGYTLQCLKLIKIFQQQYVLF